MKGPKAVLRELNGKQLENRRLEERKDIKAPIKVNFTLEYEAEILDISKDGIAIKFHPLKTHSLDIGSNLWIQIDMQERLVSMNVEVRRITEKFGHIILGMKYDRDELTTFSLPKTENVPASETPESKP
jgi:hypothetical protein